MPTLKYLGETFDCTTAIKGDNYIHLLDDNGVMVAAFDAITDFSGFTLENGSYVSPTADHSCRVAVIRDDGTIGVGGHTCEDIGNAVPKTRKVNGKPLSADITITGEDIDGIYSKDAVLTGATKTLFGMGADAVPDDVLSLLSSVVMHWWGKRTPGSTAYVETRTATNWNVQINNKSSTYYWEYSDSISINQNDGSVSLVNPVSTSINYGQSQDQVKSFFQKLKGKYCFCDQSAPNIILYFPNDSDQYLSWSNNTLTVQAGHAFSITSVYSSIPPGEVEFVSSANRNAYPDNEVIDGYEYIYLGVPWENSRVPVKVETGSYVGTGTYGSANPNSLTFGFDPKLVMINCFYNYNGIPCYMIWFSGFTRFGYMNANNTTAFSLGNTLTWHSTDNAGYQANTAGQTYEYIAFG